jgi:hypothetical protein
MSTPGLLTSASSVTGTSASAVEAATLVQTATIASHEAGHELDRTVPCIVL